MKKKLFLTIQKCQKLCPERYELDSTGKVKLDENGRPRVLSNGISTKDIVEIWQQRSQSKCDIKCARACFTKWRYYTRNSGQERKVQRGICRLYGHQRHVTSDNAENYCVKLSCKNVNFFDFKIFRAYFLTLLSVMKHHRN